MKDSIGSTPDNTPQVRALLFTDLCDSLHVVNRLGDAAAAELFQQHDRLVLTLQQRWRGQQIDRSDGLFMIFKRPADAVGFALDYQQGLLELGAPHRARLLCRAGLHVGEIMIWTNSTDAIALGAKPVEVEGLAKPLAARLMQMARPGQLLLSGVAESMVRRSQDALPAEVAERVWKSHGRWRFRGGDAELQVVELGRKGIAPLRRPRRSAKAWPILPLWRRPTSLLAEVAALALVATMLWTLLRPEPAIAFAERDWVVLADVRNLTNDPLFEQGMDQALRISLEQSRYVNVLSDLKVRDTLRRMRAEDAPAIDRDLAIQIALRDGARAVVLPTVQEVHGQLQVALQVIDPVSGVAVYSEHAEGRGLQSVLGSTDQVVSAMRARLGESLASIRNDSRPLPEVTTGDLDALRAYALGLSAYAEHRTREALEHFDQAARIDPQFAFAYVGSMRVHYSQGNMAMARTFFERAMALRNRMSPRDALYMDAWGTEFSGGTFKDIARRWEALSTLYPDHYGARANYANALASEGKYAQAIDAARTLLASQNPARAMALDFLGRMYLAEDDLERSMFYFQAATHTGDWAGSRQMAAALAAKGDLDGAEALLGQLPPSLPNSIERITFAAERGQWDKAVALSAGSLERCGEPVLCELFTLIDLNVRWSAGDAPSAAEWDAAAAKVQGPEDTVERESRLFTAMAAAWLAQRAGHPGVAKRWLPTYRSVAIALDDARARQMLAILEAGQLMQAGEPARALEALRPWDTNEALVALHVSQRQAYAMLGDEAKERGEAAWLQAHRGLAYADVAGSYGLQTRNILDTEPASRSAPKVAQPLASMKQ